MFNSVRSRVIGATVGIVVLALLITQAAREIKELIDTTVESIRAGSVLVVHIRKPLVSSGCKTE